MQQNAGHVFVTVIGVAFSVVAGAGFYGFYHLADPIMCKYDGDLESNEWRLLIEEKIDLALAGACLLLGGISFGCAIASVFIST